jgi:hypothetical protein
MSDRINRGISVLVSVAVLLALCATVNVPNNPVRRVFEIIWEML